MSGSRTVLYVHGFNGSPNGSTASAVRSFFGAENVVAPQLDLTDFGGTVAELSSAIGGRNVSLVVAHSLGAFYALALGNPSVRTIVANPCMLPSEEIPRLAPELGGKWAAEAAEREREAYAGISEEARLRTFGIFADGDELFSYRDKFRSLFGAERGGSENSLRVRGGHRIGADELSRGFSAALAFFGIGRES